MLLFHQPRTPQPNYNCKVELILHYTGKCNHHHHHHHHLHHHLLMRAEPHVSTLAGSLSLFLYLLTTYESTNTQWFSLFSFRSLICNFNCGLSLMLIFQHLCQIAVCDDDQFDDDHQVNKSGN